MPGSGWVASPVGARRGLRVALAAIVLVFVPGWLHAFEPAKAAVLRVAGFAGLAATLALVATEVVRGRSPWGAVHARHPLDACVALLALVACAATACSVSPGLSLYGELATRAGLLQCLALAGLYAGTRASHGDATDIRATCTVISGATAVSAVYALAQWSGIDPLSWAGTTFYVRDATHTAQTALRPFGTLGNATLLGAVLAPVVAMLMVRMLRTGRAKLASALMFAVSMAALVATLARAAWLAAAAGIVLAVIGSRRQWGRTEHRHGARVIWSLTIAVASVTVAALRTPVWARLHESLTGGSSQVHVEIARAAIALWRTRPWLGTGPDTFGLLFPGVQTLAYGGGLWNGLPQHAHSLVLQTLAGMGLVGVAVGVLATAALFADRPRAQASSADDRLEPFVGCVSLLVFGLIGEPGVAGASLLAVLAALSVQREPRAPAEFARAATGVPAVVACACIAVTLVGAWPAARALMKAGGAREALERSVVAPPEARAPLARAAAERTEQAASALPGEDALWRLASEGRAAEGRAAFAQGGHVQARQAFVLAEQDARQAVGLQPLRAGNHQALGMALAGLERAGVPASRAASDSAFARARALAPRDARVRIAQARVLLERGEAADALALARELERAYPEAGVAHALAAAAQLMLGEQDAAAASLDAAAAGRWTEDQGSERRAAEAYRALLAAPDRVNRNHRDSH